MSTTLEDDSVAGRIQILVRESVWLLPLTPRPHFAPTCLPHSVSALHTLATFPQIYSAPRCHRVWHKPSCSLGLSPVLSALPSLPPGDVPACHTGTECHLITVALAQLYFSWFVRFMDYCLSLPTRR